MSRSLSRIGRLLFGFAGSALVSSFVLARSAPAADTSSLPRIPNFFDTEHRAPLPDLAALKSIRFATTDDFPPFHFALADGSLTGFDVDLARAICTDLKIACTIQARRFDTLIGALKAGQEDALIAAIANTPETRKDLLFTAPYYSTPARFVAATGTALDSVTPEGLAGRTVGVLAGTAQEAYLKAFFPKVALKSYRSPQDLRAALQMKEVEAIFDGAIAMALWLNGTDSKGCCAFRGGPFTESRFFGSGVSVAVSKGNVALRQALDYELYKMTQNGTFADLYLKYFPIGFY